MSAGPDQRMTEHGAPIERDGTAIDWDSECAQAPLNLLPDDLVLIAINVLGWGALAIGVIGAALDWWLP